MLFFAGSVPAAGHAVLERSAPAANQSLEVSPSTLELWFTERIDHSQTEVRLLNASGEELPLGAVTPGDDPRYASVSIEASLGPGIYTVVYDNLSTDDGHRWQGFFPFIVLNPDGSQPAATALPVDLAGEGRSSQLPGVLDALLKWAGLAAAVLILGASVAHIAIVRPAAKYLAQEDSESVTDSSLGSLLGWTRLAAFVLLLGAGGQALLLVERLGGLSEIGDVLLDTRPGKLWLLRILLATAAGVVGIVAWYVTARRVLSVLSFVLCALAISVIAAYSLASHAAASATGGEATAIIADFLHFSATGLWLGVLAHTLLFWRPGRAGLSLEDRLILDANLLDRFSSVAVLSVFVLLVSGVFSALVQIPTWSALWSTTYGIVLLAKLALVLPLLAIAGVNAMYLKPALVNAIDARYGGQSNDAEEDEAPPALDSRIDSLRSRLSQTVRMELGLGLLVLASVAVLTQTGTARGEIALEEAEQRAAIASTPREHDTFVFNANKLADDMAVAFRVDPQLVGINTYRVELSSAEGRELGAVEQVAIRFFYNDPAFGSTEPIPLEYDGTGPGGSEVYELNGAYFSIGGGYRVQVDIRRTGMNDARAIFPLQVEQAPDEPRSEWDFPFYIGTRATTGAILLLIAVVGLLVARGHLEVLAPRLRPMGELLAICLFAGSAVLAIGAVVAPRETEGNPVPLTAESVERGRILFMRNCAQCHGDTGRGDGPAGVNLSPPPADFLVHVPYHADETLFGWISNGVQGTGMPAWADEMTEQQRWDLVNYLRKNFSGESETGGNPFDLQDAERTPTPEGQ